MLRPEGNERLLLLTAFLVGFTSLVYEVYGAKVLFLYLTETTHAVALLLSAFLAGLAVSSALVARFGETDRARRVVILLQVGAMAYAALVLRQHEWVVQVFDAIVRTFGRTSLSNVLRMSTAWLYLFVPGFCVGGAFPFLASAYKSGQGHDVSRVGVVYAWDTAGAIFGALATGFLLLPALGLRNAIWVPVGLNALTIALLSRRWQQRTLAVAAAAVLYAVGGHALASKGPSLRVGSARLEAPYATAEQRFGRIVHREQSPFGLITVSDDAFGVAGNRTLFIELRDMCQSRGKTSEEVLARETAQRLKPDSRALNIGLGCGFTAAALVDSGKIGSLTIAEINPTVARAQKRYFSEFTNDLQDNPITRLMLVDGAELLREDGEPFDAIVIDIEEPTVIHSSPLYTREYFERMRRRLDDAGVLSLWMFGARPEYAKVIHNTLSAVFMHVGFRVERGNLLFFAANRPLGLAPRHNGEARAVREVLATPIDTVNTLDNRALERHFDLSSAFGFPPGYSERNAASGAPPRD